MKKIYIVSPMGSGNTFFHTVLLDKINANIECTGHYTKLIHSVGNYIIFFRNPYDSISSSIERHLPSSNDKFILDVDPTEISNIAKINELYRFYSSEYVKFFDRQYLNNPNILRITFDFAINNESRFITTVSNFFNVENYNKEQDLEIRASAKNKIITYGFENRLPRKKSNDRLIIDNIVANMDNIEDIYSQYLLTKQEIENSLT